MSPPRVTRTGSPPARHAPRNSRGRPGPQGVCPRAASPARSGRAEQRIGRIWPFGRIAGIGSIRATLALLAMVGATVGGCSGGGGDGEADLSAERESLAVSVAERPWRGRNLDGSALTSEHYQVLTTSRSRWLTTTLPGFLEACHRHYSRLTGLNPPARAEQMTVYMMGSRREWEALTRSILGENAPHLGISVGGYCHRNVCVFWHEPKAGPALWRVAAHEGMHQFLGTRSAESLPMWVEEGLATNAEGHHIDATSNTVRFDPRDNPSRLTGLQRTLTNGHWIPLAELLSMDAGHAVSHGPYRSTAYYAQVWALVNMLQSDPALRESFRRLLGDAAAGRMLAGMGVVDMPREWMRTRAYNSRVGPMVFRRYVSEDVAGFDKRFRRFAGELAGFR